MTRHTLNQVLENSLANVPPHLIQTLSENCFNRIDRPFQGCCIGISSIELAFEVCPNVFDRIHIWRIWRPLHDSKPMFVPHGLQELACYSSSMWCGIVLLEYDVRYTICIQGINERKEKFVKDINVDIFVDCAIDKSNRTKLIANKASPYHLQYTPISSFGSYIFGLV